MTSSPPTLTGFNNNVRYRGMRFHIQTEDSGITRPHITTQLFADGGYVIKSLRTDYAEYVGHPERAAMVHRLMRDQHRAMALDLRDGKLDATIDRIAPPPVEAAPAGAAPEEATLAGASEPDSSAVPEKGMSEATPPADADTSVTVPSGTLAADGASARRATPPVAVADPDPSAAAPEGASSERSASSKASARPASSRKPPSSARASSRLGQAPQHETNARASSPKAAPRHRVIPVGEAAASSKANPSADAANRASSARASSQRRSSGSRASGGHAAATQRPPSSQKSPSSRGAVAQQPSARSGSTQRPASSRSAASQRPPSSRAATTQRPPSSRKPGRGTSRPKFTAAALSPPSKPVATTRSAGNGSNARPPSTRNPPSSSRPPSSRRAAPSSKRPPPELSNPPVPSSRRAGRPSPVLTPPKGSKSIFGALPQESLDDAILNFATTVKNGPPTRGSK